jgi:hypothetical protein
VADPGADDANRAQAAGAAMAAFQLAQYAFEVLVKSGLLPKAEAERMLHEAVEANKTGGPGNRVAAELLTVVLQNVVKFVPATRQ